MTCEVRNDSQRLGFHTLALISELLGTIFLYLHSVRAHAMCKILGYASFDGEPAKFQTSFYHVEWLGFALIVFGILLHAKCLWLEHRSMDKSGHA